MIVRSAFPTVHHLIDAARTGLILTLALLLAAAVPAAQGGRFPALDRPTAERLAPALAGAALILAVVGLTRLRRLLPIEVRLDARGLEVHAPPGVPLRPAETRPGLRPRGGRLALGWSEVSAVETAASGLIVKGALRELHLPWRHGRAPGLLGVRVGAASAALPLIPAFRFAELDWLRAVIERYRGGDPGAVGDALGLERPGEAPSSPLPEEPTWTLPWLSPARLRVVTVLLAAALALGLWRSAGGIHPPVDPSGDPAIRGSSARDRGR